jgi:hypothetical protein
MAGKRKQSIDNTVYQSLRSTSGNSTQSLHNIFSIGVLVSHLLEREYAVYAKVNQVNEVVIRIYDDQDRYELIIYPHEDAREVILSTCSRFGGKEDLAKALQRVNLLVEALVSS